MWIQNYQQTTGVIILCLADKMAVKSDGFSHILCNLLAFSQCQVYLSFHFLELCPEFGALGVVGVLEDTVGTSVF